MLWLLNAIAMVLCSSATINLTASKHKLEVVAEKEETFFDFDFQRSMKNIWRGICFATMRFLSKPQLSVQALFDFASRIWNRICFLFNWHIRSSEPVKYKCAPISPISSHRLGIVPKKTLVLDLDETLVHSCHGSVSRNKIKTGTPHDFVIKVFVEKQLVTFHVYKRPYVDYFLEIVSQWYNVVLFTASLEVYGDAVADKLDGGRNILRRRYYRQHCTPDFGSYTKDISSICNDLSKICIVDNCPGAYRCFPNNAIPIQSYHTDPLDKALLRLLPLLDALRFTKDVRSVLSRNLHLNRAW